MCTGARAVLQRVVDQVGDDLLEPAGIGLHQDRRRRRRSTRAVGSSTEPSALSTASARSTGRADSSRRVGLEPAQVVEVVGQPGDALGVTADRPAHALDPLGVQLVGVALERGAETEHRGERLAQVEGHRG